MFIVLRGTTFIRIRSSLFNEYDFAEPPQEGLEDLLTGVDNAELHYCRADVRAEEGNPVARLGPLDWTCIGSPEGRAHIRHT